MWLLLVRDLVGWRFTLLLCNGRVNIAGELKKKGSFRIVFPFLSTGNSPVLGSLCVGKGTSFLTIVFRFPPVTISYVCV